MKLFKTITSKKQCEVCWCNECLGADAIPIKSGITELCSAVDEGTAYDIYLTDFFILHHDTSETDWWCNACDTAWSEGLSNKWIEQVKEFADSELWLYGLYAQNMLVGYAVQRPMTDEEKQTTYNVHFNLDAYVQLDVTASSTEQALENAIEKLRTMSNDELRKLIWFDMITEEFVRKEKEVEGAYFSQTIDL